MIRLAARRLWTRRLQALAPLIALLAATLGFQAVLVSARSTQSHVQGVIAANWNPPYDLLVHPASLVTGLHPGDQLAQPDFLDSVGGGITLDQVAAVRATDGVSVAAPLGVVAVDYLMGSDYSLDPAALPHPSDFNFYRITTTYTSDGGLSTVPTYTWYMVSQGMQPPYVRPLTRYYEGDLLRVDGRVIQCSENIPCFSAPDRTPASSALVYLNNRALDPHRFFHAEGLTVPIVAVDPVAENALFGLNRCITSGRQLSPNDTYTVLPNPGLENPVQIPVLVNAKPGFDERIHVQVELAQSVAPLLSTLTPSDGPKGTAPTSRTDTSPGIDDPAVARAHLTFTPVAEINTSLDAQWAAALGAGFLAGDRYHRAVDGTVNSLEPAQFTGTAPNLKMVVAASDSPETFNQYSPTGGQHGDDAPAESADRPLHTLDVLKPAGESGGGLSPYHDFDVLGQYDPSCVSSGSPQLSKGAFDVYANPDTTTSDGRKLGPNASMTNVVTPMPALMTNLAGGQYFADPKRFSNGKGTAFVSVVRVKVSGTDVPGPASEKRLQDVAAAIHRGTGLAVDIIKGSSTETMSVSVPAGYFGRPALVAKQDWMHENVAINFFNAINATTVVMSIVVAAVAVLLTMQTTYATVRRRRTELVLLRAVGWPSWRLALLMELEVIALGAVVALVALAAAGFIILVNHPGGGVEVGILLAAPAAIALTAIAGAGPAFIASRTKPLAALRGPGRLRRRHRRLIRGPFSLGIREALTTWRWQTLLGALATAVGALFLGAVLAIVHDFHVSLDSTALAQQLSNEVGPFDVLLGVLAVALGATTAVGVVLVATRERLPHFATLRALGWSRVKVAQVVAGQAIAVGLLGGVLGVIALSILANRVKTGIALTISSQLSPLLLGLATGVAAALGAVRLVYRRVIVTVLRVG